MHKFLLFGHDCPLGKYPAPVIPIGELDGKLVAVYPGSTLAEPLDNDLPYVIHRDHLRKKLQKFDYRTDRLFAYDEQDVTFFPATGEASFFVSFLRENKSRDADPFVRLMIAKHTGDLAIILREMARCSEQLVEVSPSFVQDWCARELLQLFEQIDLRNVVKREDAAKPVSKAGKRPLILIADDEKELVNSLEFYFRSCGYEVATAYDGAEAITKIRQQKPRLILLDIMMPVMDGIQVLEQLRSDEHLKNTPVIVLSAVGEEMQIRDKVMHLGANAYLQKPYMLSDLEREAKKFLRSA